ncbi:response regulator [Mucilaginibacter sp. KACC 22063]|uniref:response regulator n=1 Tax=Mucilaginibacter sp. KACC 22063 TaxID=3025666 RepID=UPI002366907A|nr:response regulator [Mucilaginibacter sp. KACC 22063]WDF53942.1 response regulator [Mucilaginibacter sp. KACC 22063]
MILQKHLLIVEDNEDIAEVLKEIFTDNGYRVTAINEAADIVQTVQEINPDLIITDYILSGINGGEYCSQIKKNPLTAHIPVVILSGYAKVLESLGSYGADLVMYKPFDNDDLYEKVNKLLVETHK